MAQNATTNPSSQPDRAPLHTKTRPGCPAWCRGHRDYKQGPAAWLSHHSETAFAGITLTASLMFAENYAPEPVVMVMRHDEPDAVYVTQDDAAKWATILDGAGAADLAARSAPCSPSAVRRDRHPVRGRCRPRGDPAEVPARPRAGRGPASRGGRLMIRRVAIVLVYTVALNAMGILTGRKKLVTLGVAWVLFAIVPAVVFHVRERRP